MKAIISVWMQPVYARKNVGMSKTMYILLSLTTLASLIVFYFASTEEPGLRAMIWALLACGGLILATLIFTWFVMLVPNITLQYTPANASLVPGLKRNLQVALAIPVLLLPLGFACLNHDHFSLSWFFGVVALLIYAAAIRTQWAYVVITLLFLTPIAFDKGKSFFIDPTWNQPVLFFAVGLGLTVLVLQWVFKLHGDQHFTHKENFAMMQKQMNGEEISNRYYSLNFINPYTLLLRLSMKKVKRNPAKAGDLMLFSLGAQVFWMTSFFSVVFMAALLFIVFAVLGNHSSKFDEKNIGLAYFVGLVSLIMLSPIYSSIVRSLVYQRKGELGLLMLTAKLPDPHQQGRLLLQSMLRQFLGLWLTTTFIFGSAIYLLQTSTRMSAIIWIISFCLLPVSVLSLNNYARMESTYQTSLLAAMGIPVVLGIISIVVYVQSGFISAWQICAAITLTTAIILYWRWLRLAKVTVIFPAGRAV